MKSVDVVIIGAGPSGLFAVFQCGMLGLSCAVFDSLPAIGGQCTALYPEKPIYDIPGLPAVLAGDLIANLAQQIAPFQPVFHLNQQIVSLSNNNGFWILFSNADIKISAKAVIIAAGAGAFGPNRPPLDKLEEFEGHSVFYMVTRKDDFRDKTLVIAGGGDSAIDWTLALAPIAKHITLVHRREKFRAAPENLRQLEALIAAQKVDLAVPYQLNQLKGQDKKLSAVSVIHQDGTQKLVPADVLLAFFGLAASLGPIAEWGLSLDHNHIMIDPETCATNIQGIYAIGDIATYRNKMKLILTGFHEAAMAAHDIRRSIYPDQAFHFEYSTTKGLPKAS